MDDDELIAAAGQALDEAVDAANLLPSTYADRGGPSVLAETADRLRARLVPRHSPNPSFVARHRLAASMVLLAATDPEAYVDLVGPVHRGWTGHEPEYPSVDALVGLDNILSLVGDDNDLSLVEIEGTTALRPGQPNGASTVTPASLLRVVEPLLSKPMPSP